MILAVWFYVDDQFEGHKKVRKIPRKVRAEAIGLWTLAGTWCARYLTDGFVPGHMIEELCGSPRAVEALVAVRLWAPHSIDGETGFVFVDWAQWQKSREQVERARDANAKRQEKFKAKRKGEAAGEQLGLPLGDGDSNGDADAVGNAVTEGVSNNTPSHPSHPSHPSTELASQVPARDAADATPDAVAGDGSLPGMPEPPPRPDNRTEGQKLVDLWISDLCQGKRPPNRVVGHLGREISLMLNRDKIPREDVEAGLRAWHDKRLSASQLAGVVHELRIADTPQASTYTRRPANGVRPSHTDARVAAGLSAIEKLRAREEAEEAAAATVGQTPKEIMR